MDCIVHRVSKSRTYLSNFHFLIPFPDGFLGLDINFGRLINVDTICLLYTGYVNTTLSWDGTEAQTRTGVKREPSHQVQMGCDYMDIMSEKS